MRQHFPPSIGALALVILTTMVATAADVFWTNTAGGNWSRAANWNPNGLPGAADNAFITASGSYTVTQDVSTVVASLTVGDGASTTTLTNDGHTLAIAGPSLVRSQAVFGLGGGSLSGSGWLSIEGLGVWAAGQVADATAITVGNSGVLEITGPASTVLHGGLTNAGWLRVTGEGALGFCAGTVVNSGLFELENDQPIYQQGYCGPSWFRNTGLLRKSGGVGTNLFWGVPVANIGSIEVQQGWISFNGDSSFGTGTLFFGAGTNLLDRGNIYFDGTIVSTNAELAGATLFGTNSLRGAIRWTAGNIDGSARVTVAADGEMEITGPAAKLLGGRLTNQGVVRLTGPGALGFCSGNLQNSGLFGLENDQPIYQQGYCGPSLFSNTGLLRKSSGVGTNQFVGVPLANIGNIEVQQGWISFAGGSWFGTGTRFLGAGTNLLDQGNVTFDGTIVSTNAELAGANLLGTNTVLGLMRWTAGNIDRWAQVTITPDGELEITGPAPKVLGGTLNNQGLARLTDAAALSLCAGTLENLGVFDLENDQPIWLGAYCGASVFRSTGLLRKSGGVGTNLFWYVPVANTGSVEVQQGWISFAGGSWFSTGTHFLGVGTNLLDQGNVTFDGMIVSTNAELAGATLLGTNTLLGAMCWTGGTIDHSAQVTIAEDGQLEIAGPAAKVLGGTLINQGLVRLTGAAALSLCAGTVENLGVFDLQNDQPIWLGAYCGASLFRNSGLLRKSTGLGTNQFWAVPVANTGTVELRSGTVAFDAGFTQTAGRTRLAGGSLSSSQLLQFKDGILCGSGDIFGDVENRGELNPGEAFGVLTVHGNYRHYGRANFELGGLVPGTSHDRLNVTGSALLSGSLNVRLASGYWPQAGDAFQVLSFGSRAGSGLKFNGLNLGGGKYLTPVYGPSDLTLLTTNGPASLYQMTLVPWAEGAYLLRYTCGPEQYYSIEACTHLTNDWVVLCTTNSPVGVIDFMDADAPNYPHRFYRARGAD